ncbi:hypothetical protein F5I97DRAFT_1248123 [Phlebopus sp. FC_14]|nr:hypothetical protein F5I97DRAFT_1248123 [Phlebopus sp. FC_14]
MITDIACYLSANSSRTSKSGRAPALRRAFWTCFVVGSVKRTALPHGDHPTLPARSQLITGITPEHKRGLSLETPPRLRPSLAGTPREARTRPGYIGTTQSFPSSSLTFKSTFGLSSGICSSHSRIVHSCAVRTIQVTTKAIPNSPQCHLIRRKPDIATYASGFGSGSLTIPTASSLVTKLIPCIREVRSGKLDGDDDCAATLRS